MSAQQSYDIGAMSTARGPTKHPFLARPLYAYDLPSGLAESLKLRSIDAKDPIELAHNAPPAESSVSAASASSPAPAPSSQTAASQLQTQASNAKVPPCTLCPSCHAFTSVSAQRAHFRSEWHRYNVQLNLRSSQLVDESTFDKLCEEVDSVHETDSDPEADSKSVRVVGSSDTITKLLKKLTTVDEEGSDDEVSGDDRSARAALTARSPLLWFNSRPDAAEEARLEQTQLGIYRNIFPDPGTSLAPSIDPRVGAAEWYRACLASMQTGRLTRRPAKNASWTGKRLKASGAQDAAKTLMMTVLDGDGYIPGLNMQSGRDSSEEEPETESDEDIYGDEESTSALQSEAGSISSSLASKDPPLRMWTVLLMGGGHFAASIIVLNPHVTTSKGRKGGQGPREERSLIVLAHKTFHRYTTRRKQGGSQAAQDATGRFAKSAGATLRRYNEEELGNDIRRLLDTSGWRELIERSEKVWIRAGARAAKGILWSWEGGRAPRPSPLDPAKEDGRLEHLPFPTRRPTIGETVRCFVELTRVKIERKTDAELEAADQAYRDTLSAKTRREEEVRQRERAARERAAETERKRREKAAAAAGPKLSDEERQRRDKLERMVEMIRKGRLEAFVNFLNKNEADVLRPDGWESGVASDDASARINARLPSWWLEQASEKTVPCTLLQLAAEGGSEEVLRYLLIERRADPTIRVYRRDGTEGLQVAYDLCPTKESRNVFRRAMAAHPDWWDWANAARVPSALTTEMEETQTGKVRDRRAALRDKARERAAKAASSPAAQREPEPAIPPPPSHATTNRLGTRTLTDSTAGLTPEMRARIEREKRARAAEERMRALAARQQQQP